MIIPSRNILLSVPMAISLVLSACSAAPKKVVSEKDDVVCIKRSDIRLVVAAIMRDVPAMENGASGWG
jgi:starvation-inducible outer membrane lipoprotein